jgi:hypothetical protein
VTTVEPAPRGPPWRHALAHLTVCAALRALHLGSDRALASYRYRRSARRRGELAETVRTYEAVCAVAPGDGLANDRRTAALAPDDHHPPLDQARLLPAAGEGADAARARRARSTRSRRAGAEARPARACSAGSLATSTSLARSSTAGRRHEACRQGPPHRRHPRPALPCPRGTAGRRA